MHSPVTAAPVSAKHSATNVCQLASGIGVAGGGGGDGGDGGGGGGDGGGDGGGEHVPQVAGSKSLAPQ